MKLGTRHEPTNVRSLACSYHNSLIPSSAEELSRGENKISGFVSRAAVDKMRIMRKGSDLFALRAENTLIADWRF